MYQMLVTLPHESHRAKIEGQQSMWNTLQDLYIWQTHVLHIGKSLGLHCTTTNRSLLNFRVS